MSAGENSGAAPATYELYPGYACNRACRYCFVEARDRAASPGPVPYAVLCRKLYAAYAAGARSVSILGGEPTLNPDLERAVRFAKRTGYKFALLFSNGLKLADPVYAARLAAAGVDAVNLNVPSHRRDVFERLTRSRGGFAALLRALGNLRALAVPALAVCVLNRLNFMDLEAYADFLSAGGVRMLTLQQIKFQGAVNPEFSAAAGVNALKVSMSECAPKIMRLADHCLGMNMFPPFVEHFVPCLLPGYETRLMDFGQDEASRGESLCLHPDGREARTLDVSLKDRRKLPACSGCAYRGRCYGVERNYLSVFGPGEARRVSRPVRPYYAGLKGEKRRLALADYAGALAEVVFGRRFVPPGNSKRGPGNL